MSKAQNSTRLVTIVMTSAGDAATSHAVTAVMASPADIHP